MKKPDFFYKAGAEKLGEDPKLVRAVCDWYWKKGVRAQLSKAAHRSVFLKSIGTIAVSRYKLYKSIAEQIKKIRLVRGSRFLTPGKKDILLTAHYQNLRALLLQRDEIAREKFAKACLNNSPNT